MNHFASGHLANKWPLEPPRLDDANSTEWSPAKNLTRVHNWRSSSPRFSQSKCMADLSRTMKLWLKCMADLKILRVQKIVQNHLKSSHERQNILGQSHILTDLKISFTAHQRIQRPGTLGNLSMDWYGLVWGKNLQRTLAVSYCYHQILECPHNFPMNQFWEILRLEDTISAGMISMAARIKPNSSPLFPGPVQTDISGSQVNGGKGLNSSTGIPQVTNPPYSCWRSPWNTIHPNCWLEFPFLLVKSP